MKAIKLVCVFSLTFSLIACETSQRLSNRGDKHLIDGNYEHAVNNFKKALKKNPRDVLLQEKLSDAQSKYHRWLDTLAYQADIAEQRGYSGKALILYGKIVSARPDDIALENYRRLHVGLSAKYATNISLQQTADLSKDWLSDVADLTVSSAGDRYYIDISPVVFDEQSSSYEKSQSYIVRYNYQDNPKYLEVADQKSRISQKISRLERERKSLKKNSKNQRKIILNSEKKIDHYRAQILANDYHEQTRSQLEDGITRLQRTIAVANNKIIENGNTIATLDKRLLDHYRTKDQVSERLQLIHPTIKIPVYSEYTYMVGEHKRYAESLLQISTKHDRIETPLYAETVDISHDAHPTIELEYDPILLASPRQLTNQIHVNAAQELVSYFDSLVESRRQYFFDQALSQVNKDQKFEQWVAHGLVRRRGAHSSVVNDMQHHLMLEFGKGGNFAINQLLYLE